VERREDLFSSPSWPALGLLPTLARSELIDREPLVTGVTGVATSDSVRLDDAQIQRLLLLRNVDALEYVYRHLGKYVFGVAVSVTRSPQAAEDVTQDVMLSLWQHPERYQSDLGPLRPWLGRLAHSRSVDWIRSEVARRGREARVLIDYCAFESEIEQLTEEGSDDTRGRLAALPEDERIPISLAFYGHLTYAQVAAYLGKPEGTIKSQIRRGLNRMRIAMPVGARFSDI
jgi:RNA polymerase sigma-70 factor (ECF subfamily)